MRRADTIAVLNAKCAKAKRYQRKMRTISILNAYFSGLWDEMMRRGEEQKRFIDAIKRANP